MSLRQTAQTSAAAIYLMIAGIFTMGMVAGEPEAPEWELRLKVSVIEISAMEALESLKLAREDARIAVAEAQAVLKELRLHMKETRAVKSIIRVTPLRPAPAAKPVI